jgi:uncharacterized protein (TIGR02001 family)
VQVAAESDDHRQRRRLHCAHRLPRYPFIDTLRAVRRFYLVCRVLLACVLTTQPAGADAHGVLTLASDYVLRGVSQSDRQPVLQSELRYDAASGAYAGVFASPVAYAQPQRQRGLEADLYLGYAANPSPDLALDIGVRRYAYLGVSDAVHADFNEVHADLSYRALDFGVSYSPRYYDGARRSFYLHLDYLRDLGAHTQLLLHLGQRRAAGEHYSDGEVGLQQQWHNWRVRLAWADTPRSGACYDSGDACGSAFRIELQRQFPLSAKR